jgi:hypothetical protein
VIALVDTFLYVVSPGYEAHSACREATGRVEVRLLGPVEMHAAGQTLDLGTPQRRTFLAALAVDAGHLPV